MSALHNRIATLFRHSALGDCIVIGIRTDVRNLKILILLVIKISRFTRNDKKENYDTVF